MSQEKRIPLHNMYLKQLENENGKTITVILPGKYVFKRGEQVIGVCERKRFTLKIIKCHYYNRVYMLPFKDFVAGGFKCYMDFAVVAVRPYKFAVPFTGDATVIRFKRVF